MCTITNIYHTIFLVFNNFDKTEIHMLLFPFYINKQKSKIMRKKQCTFNWFIVRVYSFFALDKTKN